MAENAAPKSWTALQLHPYGCGRPHHLTEDVSAHVKQVYLAVSHLPFVEHPNEKRVLLRAKGVEVNHEKNAQRVFIRVKTGTTKTFRYELKVTQARRT